MITHLAFPIDPYTFYESSLSKAAIFFFKMANAFLTMSYGGKAPVDSTVK